VTRSATSPTALLLLAFLTAAQASAQRPASSIVIVTGGEPSMPIPTLMEGPQNQVANFEVADHLFLRLANLGPGLITAGDRGFVPMLARSWSRRDSVTLVFELDPRARWHDGAPVTARDVLFAFARARDPAIAPKLATLTQHIAASSIESLQDIKASVDFLDDQRIALPRKIGVMGGSYGGYMTMAALTEFPDLFAAGADLFGIVNFATFFAHSEPWMAAISTTEYGDPKTQKDLLDRLSPIRRVDRIKAPLIVLHGANDTNVPVVEAEQIVAALKKRGLPVEYVLFPDEGHGWRKTANRITSTVAITRFFVKHLK